MEISPEKFGTMEILGKDFVRYKIIVENKCLQQVKNFKYLGCEISCGNEKDIEQKPAQFAQMLGILNNTFETNFGQEIFKNKNI
jgi:hypothetical protein